MNDGTWGNFKGGFRRKSDSFRNYNGRSDVRSRRDNHKGRKGGTGYISNNQSFRIRRLKSTCINTKSKGNCSGPKFRK